MLGLSFAPHFIPPTPELFVGMCYLMDLVRDAGIAAGHRHVTLDEEVDFFLGCGLIELVDNQW